MFHGPRPPLEGTAMLHEPNTKTTSPESTPRAPALARYELSRKRKGEEAQIGFKEVAYPYSESEHDVKPRALHVKQDAETVPHSHDALLHADYKTRIAEHIAHDSHHDYGKDDKIHSVPSVVKRSSALAHGVSIKKLVDIVAPRATIRVRIISISIITASDARSPRSVPTTVDSLQFSRRAM